VLDFFVFLFLICVCLEELHPLFGNGKDEKPQSEKIKEFIKLNPEILNKPIDKNGNTALMFASSYNVPDLVAFLLEFPLIDVNMKDFVSGFPFRF
jgi:ankyrin repeat protein